MNTKEIEEKNKEGHAAFGIIVWAASTIYLYFTNTPSDGIGVMKALVWLLLGLFMSSILIGIISYVIEQIFILVTFGIAFILNRAFNTTMGRSFPALRLLMFAPALVSAYLGYISTKVVYIWYVS